MRSKQGLALLYTVIGQRQHFRADFGLSETPLVGFFFAGFLALRKVRFWQQLKLRLYEQARIPEYWIVDPEDKVVFQYHLTENSVYATPLCQRDRIQFQRQSVTADVDLSTVWYR